MELRKQSQMARTIKQFAGIAMSFMISLPAFSSCKKDHDNGMLFLAPLLGGGTALPTSSSSQSVPQNSPPSSQATPFPTGVSATGSNRTVTVTWGAVTGATSYNLYWNTTPGVTIATGTKISCAASPCTHTALTNGTDYYYIVTAVGSGGESAASSEVTKYPYLSPLKTNQTVCYDGAGAVVTCAGTGQDGEYQPGRAENFTGPTQHATYITDYTTTDNATGLVWKTCSEGQTGVDCQGGVATTMDRATASGAGTGCDALNSANGGSGYAGMTGWHLPTTEEYDTILNYGSKPASFTAFFPGTTSGSYWSASTDMQTPGNYWSTDFAAGSVLTQINTTPNNVRCVNGSYAPAPVYVDNSDGTVTDKSTALVWQKCSMGQNNDATCSGSATMDIWDNALNYCNTLNLAGKTWRLPNINELKTIANRNITPSPAALDNAAFPGTAIPGYYWSSTTYPITTYAWYVRFSSGETSGALKNFVTVKRNARCVTN